VIVVLDLTDAFLPAERVSALLLAGKEGGLADPAGVVVDPADGQAQLFLPQQ
jgi:hypothetical protein